MKAVLTVQGVALAVALAVPAIAGAQGVIQQGRMSAALAKLAEGSEKRFRLTPRELEVLRLVAQGLTNEQVAEDLVISPRTVETHLTSIYSKIGVSSRSAATRYAMQQHLV